MIPRTPALILLFFASPALAVPKIDNIIVKPNPAAFSGGKPPEVEVSVSITRGRFDSGGCDARVEFGDGDRRSIDFGVAGTRTVRHVYKKGGSYKVVVTGMGATPCEGSREVALNVTGAPEPIGNVGSGSTQTYYDKSLFSQPTGIVKEGFGNSLRNQFRRLA